MLTDIIELIDNADMVLVGLGEEFNDITRLKEQINYAAGRKKIEEDGSFWLLPAYEEYCRDLVPARKDEVKAALCRLAEILQGKNYFIVSTSVNSVISEIPWKENRLVLPCGGIQKKQCPEGCEGSLQDLAENEANELLLYIENNYGGEEKTSVNVSENAPKMNLGRCPKCGKNLILNNIYAEKYDENGYLSQWQLYTKWLQGTLNKNLLILELGVGMKFPSVIRWPFEKVAFFNNKAVFCRVNENLYQMSEELKDKGNSIAKNSIDWLRGV